MAIYSKYYNNVNREYLRGIVEVHERISNYLERNPVEPIDTRDSIYYFDSRETMKDRNDREWDTDENI